MKKERKKNQKWVNKMQHLKRIDLHLLQLGAKNIFIHRVKSKITIIGSGSTFAHKRTIKTISLVKVYFKILFHISF